MLWYVFFFLAPLTCVTVLFLLQISRDRSATSLIAVQATPQQITNANLANFFYQVWSRLSKLEEEQGPVVYSSLEPSIQVCDIFEQRILIKSDLRIIKKLSKASLTLCLRRFDVN